MKVLLTRALLSAVAAAGLAGCEARTIEAYPDQLAGIGVIVKARDDGHFVQKVVDGGPAQQAGVIEGERILSIDGESTDGKPLASVVDRLRGKDGSDVVLRVEGPRGVEVVTVTRRTLAKAAGRSYEAR